MKSTVKPMAKPMANLLDVALTERLAERGFRFTAQREHVYHVLKGERDHPTAEQVFLRAKSAMPEISMATVYNCLDALVKCSLVKEVNLDRGASRYCPNMGEHCHFYCAHCERVYDIDLPGSVAKSDPPVKLPRGFKATGYDLSVRGSCPQCGGEARSPYPEPGRRRGTPPPGTTRKTDSMKML
jgi:Fur family peroxide stress response transcriptional regulator